MQITLTEEGKIPNRYWLTIKTDQGYTRGDISIMEDELTQVVKLLLEAEGKE